MASGYFKNFNRIQYGDKEAVDITARVAIIESLKNNSSYYDLYTIQEGETPESIATKLYGSPYYHWVILLTNNIVNPWYEWPLFGQELTDYIKGKYDNDIYGIHHYEEIGVNLPAGTIVDEYYPTDISVPITNQEHENTINENKRKIKILKQEFLSQIENELRSIINAGTR